MPRRTQDQQQDNKKRNILIVSSLAAILVFSVFAMAGTFELTVQVGYVEMPDGSFTVAASGFGPHDPDYHTTYTGTIPGGISWSESGAYVGYPNVRVTITTPRHTDDAGTTKPDDWYEDSFEVVLDNGTYKEVVVFDLHRWRFAVTIKTTADLGKRQWDQGAALYIATMNFGECDMPSGWWGDTSFSGKLVDAYVYPSFQILPWSYRSLDPTDYGYPEGELTGVWSGVLQAHIVDLQAGNLQDDVDDLNVATNDKWIHAVVHHDEVAANLDLLASVGGATLEEHTWNGLGLGDEVHSSVFISSLYAGILPGSFWKCNEKPWVYDPNPERWYDGRVINGVVVYEVEVLGVMTHRFYLHNPLGTTTTNVTTTGPDPPPYTDPTLPILVGIALVCITIIVVFVSCVLVRYRGLIGGRRKS